MKKILPRGIAGLALGAGISISHAEVPEYPLANGAVIKPEARAAVYAVNTLGNALACSLVAAYHQRDVLKASLKCALAGSIQSAGMELGMSRKKGVPGVALRIVETGTSMIDNTIAGRNLFDRFHYGFGPVLLQLDTNNRKQTAVYWRALPAAGIVYNVAQGHKFSLEDTLSYQTTTFYREPSAEDNKAGVFMGNVMMYERAYGGIVTDNVAARRAHEFAHVLQYVRVQPVQQAVPRRLAALEERLHWRVGEDIALGLLSLPETICSAAGGKDCEIQPYNLKEVEAYTMQTAVREE